MASSGAMKENRWTFGLAGPCCRNIILRTYCQGVPGWCRLMRKPGEPIYLRIHFLALIVVIASAVALPRLAEVFVGPLHFGTRVFSGLAIAVVGGIALYLLYSPSARNEP